MTTSSRPPGRRAAARQRHRHHHPAKSSPPSSSSSSRTSRPATTPDDDSGDADESFRFRRRRRKRHVVGDGFKISKRGGGSSGRRFTMWTTVVVGATILLLLVFVLYVYASYLLRVASVLDGRRRRGNRHRRGRGRDINSPPVGLREGGGGGSTGDDDHGSRPWKFDEGVALEVQRLLLENTGRKSPILTAYVEPPLPPPRPRRSVSGSNANTSNSSVLPRLALRTHGPEALRRYTYPRLDGCGTLPSSLPVDMDDGLDDSGGTGRGKRKGPMFPHRYENAERHHRCPVDADPFLPWIHDVFPTSDGQYVEFVSHNKRRCNTDSRVYADDLSNLEPQVTLMQPIPLKRLTEVEANELAPDLWRRPKGGAAGVGTTRYRLASYGDADHDASYTRFLCRFHSHVPSSATHDDGGGNNNNNNNKNNGVGGGVVVRSVFLGETTSVYPYNYEYANHKKPQHHPMLTGPPDRHDNRNRTDSAHNEQFWNAVLHFRCPVPTPDLRESIATGETVVDDVATVYVDLVPVRTYPRLDELGYLGGANETRFVPDEEWGRRNVLPRVEVSGRWANVPVCRPPGGIDDVDRPSVGPESGDGGGGDSGATTTGGKGLPPHGPGVVHGGGLRRDGENQRQRLSQTREIASTTTADAATKKPHHQLVACTWASASFHTRGGNNNNGMADTSTTQRLLEWLTYHLYVADFDHVYVYDNSAAHSSDDDTRTDTSSLSLEPIVDMFPPDRVTRIDWPFRVCNNNPPASSNPGERSSQYAAEASCRLRYGPRTEWMSFLDVDEYIIPQRGNRYGGSIKRWLMDEDAVGRETKILSFFQTRAKPNVEFMERASRRGDDGRGGGGGGGACGGGAFPVNDAAAAATDDERCPLLTKRPDATYLETYDCDPTPLPKPGWGWRAKKQIYRPWYVLYHHVHYPTVTRRLIDRPNELSLKYNDRKPSERRVDELREAFMIHAKTTDADSTYGWRDKCRKGGDAACPVGIPWPGVDGTGTGTDTGDGGGAGGEGRREKVDANGMAYNCHRHGAVEDVLPRLRAELAPLIERYTAKRFD